ncbi:DUF4349 domain-containing protein [Actinokineospora fastidiosa]|uniref:Lipoprotein n=1 Tax=Actinokineospora fastidiosa TaxID=1816 RepID=A0A918L8V7_9PSEU|nr:DUF4349 domain-containing protein [Actinokineospora fastidiosa]GGS22029.1 lipoprotein [Actinokineospora fastidiosa]
MTRNRLLAVLLLAAVGVAGCTASDSSGSAAYAPSAPTQAEDSRSDGGSGAGADEEAKAEAPQIDQPGVERKLIRTASVSVTVPVLSDAVARARQLVAGVGGYTGDQEHSGNHATMTLHVPSDHLDRVVTQVSELGTVTRSAQTATDVTEQLVDVESRIETQRASVDRVRALLAKATTIDDIVRIESELTQREADLESLLKRRETLSGQVAVSTLTLSLRESSTTTVHDDGDEEGIGEAFRDGWTAFTDVIAAIGRGLARSLPFLVVIAAVLAGVWVRWVRPRRRRGTVAADAAE